MTTAIAAYEARFSGLELQLERINGRISLMQWMLAILITGVGSLIIKAFA